MKKLTKKKIVLLVIAIVIILAGVGVLLYFLLFRDTGPRDIVYDKPGTYDEKGKTYLDASIEVDGVTIKNATFNNITISQDVKEGSCHLNTITVKDKLDIYGGGENSIYLEGVSKYKNVNVNKNDTHIIIDKDVSIETLTVTNYNYIEVHGYVQHIIVGDSGKISGEDRNYGIVVYDDGFVDTIDLYVPTKIIATDNHISHINSIAVAGNDTDVNLKKNVQTNQVAQQPIDQSVPPMNWEDVSKTSGVLVPGDQIVVSNVRNAVEQAKNEISFVYNQNGYISDQQVEEIVAKNIQALTQQYTIQYSDEEGNTYEILQFDFSNFNSTDRFNTYDGYICAFATNGINKSESSTGSITIGIGVADVNAYFQ